MGSFTYSSGGIDSMLFELIAISGLTVKTLNIGLEPSYRFKIGDRLNLQELVGIGPQFVLNSNTNNINNL